MRQLQPNRKGIPHCGMNNAGMWSSASKSYHPNPKESGSDLIASTLVYDL